MDIGLNVLDNLRVSIGENIKDILGKLDDMEIQYIIPYKNTEDMRDSSYIVYIEKFGMELRLRYNRIIFIKTTNTELNYIMSIENKYPALVIHEIKSKLMERFEMSSKNDIYIDRFEAKTFNSVVTIPYNKTSKVKITLVMGNDNSIYLEKIELIHK